MTDKNGCSIEQSYTLIDPELPVITGIAAKTILCTGSKTTLSPDGLWSKYLWSNAQGALSGSSKYETDVPGTYTLTTWDARNCPAKKAFEIEVSDNVLHADFLRLSEAFTLSTGGVCRYFCSSTGLYRVDCTRRS